VPPPDLRVGAGLCSVASFLDPAGRDFWVDRESHAREIAACLRAATSETPADPRLAEVIDEPSFKSPDFVRLWSGHPVAECSSTDREYHHPVVGRLTWHDESLRVPDAPGQRLNFMSAAPGSESAQRLRRPAALSQ
jgi:hypothetical protein